jgi:hypothetical protein
VSDVDYYQVVQVDAEGMFLDQPEMFDTKREAKEHFEEVCKDHPDLEFAVFECSDITGSMTTQKASE